MSLLSTPQVPSLEPAGTVVAGAPRRSLSARIVNRLGGGAAQALATLVALIWLVPTTGLAVASLRSAAASTSTGWWTAFSHPSGLSFDNYTKLFGGSDMTKALWNTVLITVPTTVLVVVISALAAYALAWLDFKGRDTLFIVLVALIAVPVQTAIIPDAKFFDKIGIFGSFAGVIAFHVAFGLPFGIFLMRNFFIGIPRDLLEAARIDGGSEFTIFFRVVLPIGWPAIASLTIYQFMWVWNDLLIAKVFSGDSSKPVTVVLQESMGAFSSNIDILAPGAFLSMLVPLMVFFAFQRYYVQGVLSGSVK